MYVLFIVCVNDILIMQGLFSTECLNVSSYILICLNKYKSIIKETQIKNI